MQLRNRQILVKTLGVKSCENPFIPIQTAKTCSFSVTRVHSMLVL